MYLRIFTLSSIHHVNVTQVLAVRARTTQHVEPPRNGVIVRYMSSHGKPASLLGSPRPGLSHNHTFVCRRRPLWACPLTDEANYRIDCHQAPVRTHSSAHESELIKNTDVALGPAEGGRVRIRLALPRIPCYAPMAPSPKVLVPVSRIRAISRKACPCDLALWSGGRLGNSNCE